MIGANCNIGRGVKISGNTIIGDMCIIEDGVVLENAIIWPDVYLGRNTKIKNAIVGSWSHLDSNVTVEEHVVIANRCRIKTGISLAAGAKISPDTTV